MKIINTSYYSTGFPQFNLTDFIERSNYISQIDDKFKHGANLVFLNGEEDSGKTILCAQYVLQKVDTRISIFFNPHHTLDYKKDFYCNSFVYQAKHILGEIGLETLNTYYGYEDYTRTIFELRKLLRSRKEKITLIIDGLEDKINEDEEFITEIFSIIPFGEDFINIVISGNEKDYSRIHSKTLKQRVETISVIGFSKLETKQYLNDYDFENSDLDEINNITKGFPGRLNTLKRIMATKTCSFNEITGTSAYTHWIELDCNSVNLKDPLTSSILSLLALTDKSYSDVEVSKICKVSIDEIQNVLVGNSLFEKIGDHFRLVSNGHKNYFANLLRGNKNKVEKMLLNYYVSDESINSIIELPKIHAKAKEWNKVLDVLDGDYLDKIVEGTGSLEVVNESLKLGVEASSILNKYSHLWRYSIQGSIVNELDNFSLWEAEIEARISVEDFTGAVLLAETAVLKVDRLRLLAMIAKRQKQMKSQVDEDLSNLIRSLYNEIELYNVGVKIYDIVGNLLYAIPNLAIEIIEKSSGSNDQNNINDWIITKLSFAAIDSSLKANEQSDHSRKVEALQTLNNPRVQKINKAISFLVGNYSSDRVIVEVNKLEDSNEKLRLLRLWLDNNKTNINGIDKVMDLAIDQLVVESSNSSITIDLLKELSNNLPYLKDGEAQKRLYLRFKNLSKNINNLGLSKNKYIFELNLIHTLYNLNNSAWHEQLNSLIREVESISDNLVRLDSFGEIYSKLSSINNELIKKKIGFVYAKIIELSKIIFNETGSHFKVAEYILKTVSKKNPMLGLKICELINTFDRREKSKMLILESYLNNNLKNVKIDLIKKIEESIQDKSVREKLIIDVLERYSEARSLHFNTIKDLFHFYTKLNILRNRSMKLYGLVLGYKIISKNEEWKVKLGIKYEESILETWHSVEGEWQKIESGYNLCVDLSDINQNLAQRIFSETQEIKKDCWIDSQTVAHTYKISIKIITKAFINLLNTSSNIDREYRAIEDVIARIGSKSEKLLIWTELGFQAYISDKESFCKKILDNHILPIIDDIKRRKEDFSRIDTSLIFIHLFNSELTFEYAKELSDKNREELYGRICYFYLTKRCPFDIYEENILRYSCTFNDLSKAITALGNIKNDSNFYTKLNHICKAIKGNRTLVTGLQIGEIVSSLKSMVDEKLPDPNNIKHDGYKILCNAKLMALQPKSIDHKKYWNEIVDLSNNIPNVSDRIFVGSFLLEEIPFDKVADSNLKKDLFGRIVSELNRLTVHYEFVQRVIDISNIMYETNRAEWKKVVDKAFVLTNSLEEGSEVYESQKNIIDSMYRLDPDYAKNLIQSVDVETRDRNVNKLIKDHYQGLVLSTKIKNSQTIEDKEKANSRLLIKAVIETIQSLNSGRSSAKKISEITHYLQVGNSSLPLHEVFPIYMYYLINCGKTYNTTKLSGAVANIHKDNFYEALKASELTHLLLQKRKNNLSGERKFFVDEIFNENQVVHPGSREEAFNFIRAWLNDVANEFLLIADPYLEKEDLEILKLIKECCPSDLDIEILGSNTRDSRDYESDFKNYWKKISDEDAPFTRITFCWLPEKNNGVPFHDRWILTKNGGLRLGTSINSLGIGKESEISIMAPSEALNIRENTLKEYVTGKKRELNNQRLQYKSFNL